MAHSYLGPQRTQLLLLVCRDRARGRQIPQKRRVLFAFNRSTEIVIAVHMHVIKYQNDSMFPEKNGVWLFSYFNQETPCGEFSSQFPPSA